MSPLTLRVAALLSAMALPVQGQESRPIREPKPVGAATVSTWDVERFVAGTPVVAGGNFLRVYRKVLGG